MRARTCMIVLVTVISCKSSTPSPDTTGGGDDCEPGRCLDDISAKIMERRAEARACFDEGVKRQPGLERGFLVINFEIDPAGKVVSTSPSMKEGQIDEPGIVACIGGVIETIEFAASGRGKTSRGYHRFEFGAR
jgi:hypothetical protein